MEETKNGNGKVNGIKTKEKEKERIMENRKELLSAVKLINNSGLIGNKIPVVGKGTSTKELLENFISSVNALVDGGKAEALPTEVISFYNSLAEVVETELEPEPEPEPEEMSVTESTELPNSKKELRKYIKENNLDIKVTQKDSVADIKEKIAKVADIKEESKISESENNEKKLMSVKEVKDKAKKVKAINKKNGGAQKKNGLNIKVYDIWVDMGKPDYNKQMAVEMNKKHFDDKENTITIYNLLWKMSKKNYVPKGR